MKGCLNFLFLPLQKLFKLTLHFCELFSESIFFFKSFFINYILRFKMNGPFLRLNLIPDIFNFFNKYFIVLTQEVEFVFFRLVSNDNRCCDPSFAEGVWW